MGAQVSGLRSQVSRNRSSSAAIAFKIALGVGAVLFVYNAFTISLIDAVTTPLISVPIWFLVIWPIAGLVRR